MNNALAQKTVRDYLCAKCWGHLIMKFGPNRSYIVECAEAGKEHEGYVTKYFVEQRRAESRAERHEVDQLLDELGIIERPHKHDEPEDIIRELGF